MKTFKVDLPNPSNPEGEWIEVASFDTREEAEEWTARLFGATGGKIDLISEIEE